MTRMTEAEYDELVDDERLTVSQIAAELAISPATFRTYVMRDQAPNADGYFDKRTPFWFRSTLKAWRPAAF